MAWPAEGKKAFIDMQFEAQSNHYLNHYANAAFMIIEMEGRSIGRLYVDRTATEIRIVDISLLPQYRRRGIGTMYLQTLLEEATGRGVPVTIHVETFNPAMQFYLRLGFRQKCTNGLYHFLQWTSKPEDPGC